MRHPSPPAILLRESCCESGRIKKRTLLNLSDWPHERIAGLKALLKGGTVRTPSPSSAPCRAVEAALGTARRIGLDRLIGPAGNRCRDLVLPLVISRLIEPGSKWPPPVSVVDVRQGVRQVQYRRQPPSDRPR
jgi:hypothetical protein